MHIPTYIHTYAHHTYVRTYIHTYVHIYKQTYLPTYRTTTLERFLLKRQLMGPAWLRIRRPAAPDSSATIAKCEFRVTDPKLIIKLQVGR